MAKQIRGFLVMLEGCANEKDAEWLAEALEQIPGVEGVLSVEFVVMDGEAPGVEGLSKARPRDAN